jgi:hypothetical protein
MFRRLGLLAVLLGIVAVLLAACGGGAPAADLPQDPTALLDVATQKMRAVNTFRMNVIVEGAPYNILVDLDGGQEYLPMRFIQAKAQFLAPDLMQAEVRIMRGTLSLEVELFGRGDEQWFRLRPTPLWLNQSFQDGFNPGTLLGENTGFQAAMSGMRDLQRIGEETLEDGTNAIHVQGITSGENVRTLAVGLIQSFQDVTVDVYIDRSSGYPVRVSLTQPETITPETPDPTKWIIDIEGINEAPVLDLPPGVALPATAVPTVEVGS